MMMMDMSVKEGLWKGIAGKRVGKKVNGVCVRQACPYIRR
jgi:hypothetical protein